MMLMSRYGVSEVGLSWFGDALVEISIVLLQLRWLSRYGVPG